MQAGRVLRGVLRRGGLFLWVFYSKKGFREGFSEGVLGRGASRRCLERPLREYDPVSGQKKAHKLLTHKLFERQLTPGQPAGSQGTKLIFSVFRREHINFFVRLTGRLSGVNRTPSKAENVYVYVPLSSPTVGVHPIFLPAKKKNGPVGTLSV